MINILYICTHNRCRSIMSEAIAKALVGSGFCVFSAGSQPSGVVHPLSLRYLEEAGYNIENLRSQSWDEFVDKKIDLVITVCDQAAGESCPLWMGNVAKLHWPLTDPSKLEGDGDVIRNAFFETIQEIERRVRLLQSTFENHRSVAEAIHELNQRSA